MPNRLTSSPGAKPPCLDCNKIKEGFSAEGLAKMDQAYAKVQARVETTSHARAASASKPAQELTQQRVTVSNFSPPVSASLRENRATEAAKPVVHFQTQSPLAQKQEPQRLQIHLTTLMTTSPTATASQPKVPNPVLAGSATAPSQLRLNFNEVQLTKTVSTGFDLKTVLPASSVGKPVSAVGLNFSAQSPATLKETISNKGQGMQPSNFNGQSVPLNSMIGALQSMLPSPVLTRMAFVALLGHPELNRGPMTDIQTRWSGARPVNTAFQLFPNQILSTMKSTNFSQGPGLLTALKDKMLSFLQIASARYLLNSQTMVSLGLSEREKAEWALRWRLQAEKREKAKNRPKDKKKAFISALEQGNFENEAEADRQELMGSDLLTSQNQQLLSGFQELLPVWQD